MNQKEFSFHYIAHDQSEAKKLARRTDPESSHRAAVREIESGRVASQKMMLLDAVYEHPMLTSKEYATLTGLDRYQAARRLADLKNDQQVEQVAQGGREVRWRCL